MTIRFPQIHIAESVSNRILNIAQGLPTGAGVNPQQPQMSPSVLDQSAQLNAQINTPPGPAELPAGADGAVVGAALTGEPLVDGVIEQVAPGL